MAYLTCAAFPDGLPGVSLPALIDCLLLLGTNHGDVLK